MAIPQREAGGRTIIDISPICNAGRTKAARGAGRLGIIYDLVVMAPLFDEQGQVVSDPPGLTP
jgi:hypothetical protein